MLNIIKYQNTLTLIAGFLLSNIALAQPQSEDFNPCGTLWSSGQYGPYDYRVDLDKLPIVLHAHFTPEVEALIRGKTSTTPGHDIDYTLRAIPNNPRALVAMMRLAEKEKTPKPYGASYNIDCYFERALRFKRDDYIVRMIYAGYLTKQGKNDVAISQLNIVEEKAGDNPFTRNNLGLLFFDLKEYEKAIAQANLAHALGIQKSALFDKLEAIGKHPIDSPVTPKQNPDVVKDDQGKK